MVFGSLRWWLPVLGLIFACAKDHVLTPEELKAMEDKEVLAPFEEDLALSQAIDEALEALLSKEGKGAKLEQQKKELMLILQGEGDASKHEQHYYEQLVGNFSGRSQAGLKVLQVHCPVYRYPSMDAEVVGYLERGEDVHVQAVDKGWIKIGKYQFVPQFWKEQPTTTFPLPHQFR